MKLLGKRVASVALAGSLVLTGLAGCSGPVTSEKTEEATEEAVQETTATEEQTAEQKQATAEPTTAAELVQKANENSIDSGHAKFEMTMEATADYTSFEMGVTGDFDYVGEDRHGTMTATAFGLENTSEFYSTTEGTQTVTYLKGADDTTWTRTTDESSMPIDELTQDTLLSQGEFAKTTTGYTITVPGKSVYDLASSSAGASAETSDITDDAAFTEALNNSTAVYSFDTAYRLTSMSYNLAYAPAATAEATDETEVTDDGSLKMTITLTFSNQGQVQASAVTVPESVKSGSEDGTSSTTGTNGTTTGTTTTDSDSDSEYGYDDTDYSSYDDTDYSSYDDTTSYDDTETY